jgi:hypothetical protein
MCIIVTVRHILHQLDHLLRLNLVNRQHNCSYACFDCLVLIIMELKCPCVKRENFDSVVEEKVDSLAI